MNCLTVMEDLGILRSNDLPVLGSRDGVADNRPLAMLTRFVTATAPQSCHSSPKFLV
jgi:hypothetical protein